MPLNITGDAVEDADTAECMAGLTATSSPAPITNIAVIIVNYGTPDLAIKAAASILARAHGGRLCTVHIVDNASPDNSAAALQAAHTHQHWGERVILHLEAENHGFGRGNNVVMRQLVASSNPPDAVFLLNPDAFVENEVIDILATHLEANHDAGFAGAGISKPDGTAVTAAFRFPSVASEFSTALNFGPVARFLSRWEVPLSPEAPAGPVDWVAGAAVLVRLRTLADVNFFDPEFFLYYEEVDLMRRAARQGWHCLYVPQARVVHIEGEATGVKSGRTIVPRVPDYRYHSWQHYFSKSYGRAVALLAALAAITGSLGNKMLSALLRRPSRVPAFFFRDFWYHAMRPLLFGRTAK
ncbi:MAG: glycosyltransferase family 2 protein [Pseudomonadota bacterium]